MRRKLAFTFIMVAAVLFALAVYLLVLMRNNGKEYQQRILSQQGYDTSLLAFRRGNITDRNGTVLAYSEEVYNLILDPSVILYTSNPQKPEPNREATVDALVQVFGYSRDEINAILDEKPDAPYVRFARQLSAEDRDRFLQYQTEYNTAKDKNKKKLHQDKVTGVWFETEYKRMYPYDTLACTVLGFSGAESAEGHWGIEEYYNSSLSGIPGKVYSYISPEGDYESVTEAAVGGYTVVSTIDYNVQKIVEEEIANYKQKHEYKNIGVIVMDPTSGEILGMATDKVYDPNDPMDFSAVVSDEELNAMTDDERSALQNSVWRNFAVNDAFSPGSVSKELTVAMALEENVIEPDTTFYCDGSETVQGQTIHCHKLEGHGAMDVTGALMQSCNDALMNIASRLNAPTMLKWQRLFGLGSRTGIDLPGEATGILFTEENMSLIDLATCSFGQGYSSTMVQMASAYCSILNGGYYYTPHIVRQLLDENGNTVKTVEPELVRTTISESTCEFLKQAAYETVQSGGGTRAKIKGYTVGGKTGTAQKYPIEEHNYVISFMGFTPAFNPKLLVYAVIDEPEHEDTTVSSSSAVELERDIMKRIIPYLGIPADAATN
ncbi:MAG: penicillin-binding protein 2 [Lachnospiraceae bacterium]|nr:penicillin-binding protein 2 [Lachnospiraceae bacterium]